MLNRKSQNFLRIILKNVLFARKSEFTNVLTKKFFERKYTKRRSGEKFFERLLEKGLFTNVLTKSSTNLPYNKNPM